MTVTTRRIPEERKRSSTQLPSAILERPTQRMSSTATRLTLTQHSSEVPSLRSQSRLTILTPHLATSGYKFRMVRPTCWVTIAIRIQQVDHARMQVLRSPLSAGTTARPSQVLPLKVVRLPPPQVTVVFNTTQHQGSKARILLLTRLLMEQVKQIPRL